MIEADAAHLGSISFAHSEHRGVAGQDQGANLVERLGEAEIEQRFQFSAALGTDPSAVT